MRPLLFEQGIFEHCLSFLENSLTTTIIGLSSCFNEKPELPISPIHIQFWEGEEKIKTNITQYFMKLRNIGEIWGSGFFRENISWARFCECNCAHLNYNVSIFYYHHTESTDSSGKKTTNGFKKRRQFLFLSTIFWQDVILVLLPLVLGCSISTVTARKTRHFIVVFERLPISLHIY